MNVYKLDKLATPGPVKSRTFNPIDSGGWDTLTVTEHRATRVAEYQGSQAKVNAKLDVHCRNNFMRMLEALKQQVRMCEECGTRPATRWYLDTNPDQERWFCDECSHYPTDGVADGNIALVKLIAELEEVKT